MKMRPLLVCLNLRLYSSILLFGFGEALHHDLVPVSPVCVAYFFAICRSGRELKQPSFVRFVVMQ